MSIVKLKSSNGEVFEIEKKLARRSPVIKNLINESEDNIIYLPEADSRMVKLIVEWLIKHKDNPPFRDCMDDGSIDMTPWEIDFFQLNDKYLKNILLTSYAYDIQDLHVCANAWLQRNLMSKRPDVLANYLLQNFAKDDEDESGDA